MQNITVNRWMSNLKTMNYLEGTNERQTIDNYIMTPKQHNELLRKMEYQHEQQIMKEKISLRGIRGKKEVI